MVGRNRGESVGVKITPDAGWRCKAISFDSVLPDYTMYFDGSYKLNSSCTIHQHLSEALFAYNGTHFLGVGAEQDWRLLILHADARKIPFRVI